MKSKSKSVKLNEISNETLPVVRCKLFTDEAREAANCFFGERDRERSYVFTAAEAVEFRVAFSLLLHAFSSSRWSSRKLRSLFLFFYEI
ncbi:hypothetical protein A2U01_0029025 [Trifolium medium]|uniref:Uncharacterized protein n=1 Tax=Trifolium medium TaxID=97028 RepID=A0A392PAN6_9FABA|nr:hypothetical protein [Trifolium medium]